MVNFLFFDMYYSIEMGENMLALIQIGLLKEYLKMYVHA